MLKKILSFSILANLLFIGVLLFLVHTLGGVHYIWFKYQNRGGNGVYVHRKQLFEELEVKKGSIVFLGNSITEQCEWAELFGLPTIVNRGISMDNTYGLLDRLETITTAEPARVFLMIGVNDLIDFSPSAVATNYKKILARFREEAPATYVYVQSVLPVNNRVRKTTISNNDILALNKHIKELAEAFDYPYLDLHRIFRDGEGRLDGEYTADGIHLNGKGYLKWKEEILKLELIPELTERTKQNVPDDI